MVQAGMIEKVIITRVPRLRRMTLRVKPSWEILVRASVSISEKAIEKFVTDNQSWIEKQKKSHQTMRPFAHEELEEFRILAKSYLPHRTMELALELGFSYRSVSCRHQKSRWGSCSHRNDISLNIELMRLPEKLRDYIIVHELTHTLHKHHQDTFWAYLEKVLPGAGELDKQMRKWRIGYDGD